MARGNYVKLFRKILRWEWYTHGPTKDVFIHLMLTANWEDGNYRGLLMRRGQVIFGYGDLSRDLGLSVQNVRTAVAHLKSTGELTVEVTGNGSLGTLVNYDVYNGFEEEVTEQPTSKPTIDQQATNTIQEYKKNKEENNNTPIVPKGTEKPKWIIRSNEEVLEWVDGFLQGEDENDYRKMYQYIIQFSATHILHLEYLITLDQHSKFLTECKKLEVQWKHVIEAMINNPDYFVNSKGGAKKKSMYLTALDWARRRKK